MASFWTKLADVITPWDRGGERKRREEEAARKAQQPKVVRPTPQPNIQVQRNQTIGGQDFSLGVEPNRQVSVPTTPTVQRQDYDKSAIDKGLDAGRSWEDIARETNTDLAKVREHSERTRPGYGVSRRKLSDTDPEQKLFETYTKQLHAGKMDKDRYGKLMKMIGRDSNYKSLGTDNRSQASRLFDAINPFDSGRTYNRAQPLETKSIGTNLSDIKKVVADPILTPASRALYGISQSPIGQMASTPQYRHLNERVVDDFRKQFGDDVAIAVEKFLADQELERYGVNANDSKWRAANKAFNNAYATGANLIPGATGVQVATQGIRSLRPLIAGGLGGSVGATLETNTSDEATLDDYMMGGATGFAGGIGLPLIAGASRVIPKSIRNIFNRGNIPPVVDDIITPSTTVSPPSSRDIPVYRNIPVQSLDEAIDIPVRNLDPEGAIIRELGGDSPRVTNIPTREEIQQARFRNQNFGGADTRIEGVTGPVSRQEYTTKAEIDVERQALDDALANKEINKTQHKKANKDLDDMEKSLDGRKIEVQEEKTVPVREVTDIPVDDEVGAGSVRPTKVVDRTAEKTEAAARQQAQTAPPVREASSPTPEVATRPDTPLATSSGNLSDDNIMTSLIQAVQDNRKIQKAERALNRKEKAVRTKEKNRLYNEMVAQGMSRREAEARSYAAMRGKYTDLDAGTAKFAETDAERIREMVDNSSLDDWQRANTKKAFEHLIDPQKTDPLQPHERRNILRFVQDTYGKDTADLLDQAIESAGDNRSFQAKLGSFFTSSTAAADLGAPGRQGLNYWVNHPRISKQALDDSLKSAFDQKAYDGIVDTMIKDPRGSYIQEKFSGLNALTGNFDEARAKSDWASNFKGTSWYVNPSERAYNMYMTRLRWGRINDVIDRFGGVEGFEKAAQASKDPERWIKAWDKVINTGTGRGGNWNGNRGDIQVLFSARHLQSKVNRLTAPAHLKLLRDNPQAYLTQLREVGTSAGAWALALAAAHQAGLGVEDGKIKIGNTRIDISGGLVSLANAVRKGTDAIVNGTDGPFDRDAFDIATDYLSNQLSPMLASVATLFGYDLSEGKDRYGNELTPYKVATDVAPIPIGAQGVVDDAMQGTPAWQTVMNAGLDFLGFGTNTYQTAADKDNAARAETADVVGTELTSLRDSGLLNDQMISTMSDSLQKVFAEGKTPTEKELGQIKDALVKGVGTGRGADSDTAYRERGDYEKDLAVLQLKKQILEADPTTKPSNLKDLEVQIKRSEVLRDNEIPYEMFNLYQNTGLDDWRDLAETNPQLYQQLWELDEMFTKAGGSYGKGDPTTAKYYAKKSGGGSGSGSRSMTAKFYGGLSNTPERRAYAQTALSKGGTDIPVIRRVRPNIIHRIGRG